MRPFSKVVIRVLSAIVSQYIPGAVRGTEVTRHYSTHPLLHLSFLSSRTYFLLYCMPAYATVSALIHEIFENEQA